MFFSNATHAASLSLPAPKHPTEYEKQWGQHLIQDIKADFTNYMKNDNLIILGDSFLIAGILANTGLDRAFAQHWQTDLRSSTSDNLLALPKTLGGLCLYYVPTYLASMGVGHLREHTILGNVLYHWGYRSLRTVIVGGIQQAFLTNLLGSGRPNLNQDSKWQPFKYQTGVSGHAFYGAVPFLTAAMMSDPPLLKYSLYFFSTLPSISRINSNRHYLSQVILGWTLAFLSARSVYATDTERVPPFQVGLQSRSNTTMFTVSLRF
jgi:membrane-associated phospholipid phosphatase